jgi:hypothetical protein
VLVGLADESDMGWFTNEAGAMSTLTHEEKKLFERLDQAVGMATRAAKVVIEGGRALGVIRDRQLFRDVVPTWEEYLERHGLTRRRADQLVAAAQALDAVAEAVQTKTGTTVPILEELTERTARQLVGMDADTAAEAVIEAASSPEGVTAGSIRKAVAKRKKSKAAKVPRPRRFKVPGAVVTITFNRKSDGSTLNALAAATNMAEIELEAQANEAA